MVVTQNWSWVRSFRGWPQQNGAQKGRLSLIWDHEEQRCNSRQDFLTASRFFVQSTQKTRCLPVGGAESSCSWVHSCTHSNPHPCSEHPQMSHLDIKCITILFSDLHPTQGSGILFFQSKTRFYPTADPQKTLSLTSRWRLAGKLNWRCYMLSMSTMLFAELNAQKAHK